METARHLTSDELQALRQRAQQRAEKVAETLVSKGADGRCAACLSRSVATGFLTAIVRELVFGCGGDLELSRLLTDAFVAEVRDACESYQDWKRDEAAKTAAGRVVH
jgi:hypothetical protein